MVRGIKDTLRLEGLRRLYALYDRFLADQEPMACRRGCADCCTRDVTLTTLEGAYIQTQLTPGQWRVLQDQVRCQSDRPRYHPQMTTNALARHCLEGRDPPREDFPVERLSCPLLHDACCPVYALRPFGCRCLVSRQACGPHGYAEVDEWVLTVNTLFMQAIEHLDRPGCFGNFSDVVLAIAVDGEVDHPAAAGCGAFGLLANQPIPAFMIPPGHRARAAALVAEIQRVMGGQGR